ncbi:hypothetical protein CFP56_033776 [Quercus suber]|uniref:Uncharacterized protein n=1 Tax=Quercus suber TaxID=58331 RepID=A0AAW0LU64_QUESU
MLGYAASHCQWNQHAQQLTQGGELLTHVWLLIWHILVLLNSRNFRQERAKLTVK